MSTTNFRTPTIAELYGNPNIGAPAVPGQINWTTVVITGTIVLVGIIVTVSIITRAHEAQMKKIILLNQNNHDESITTIRDENAELRSMVFELINMKKEKENSDEEANS